MNCKADISECIIDVVIPVCKPRKYINELIRRISVQSIKVRYIYILDVIQTKRYKDIHEFDNIYNFSYENGKIRYNGLQMMNDDICYFEDHDNVKIIKVSEKDILKGLIYNIRSISDADYVMCISQDIKLISRLTVERMLQRFEENVLMVSSKYSIDKKRGYIDRCEYSKAFDDIETYVTLKKGYEVTIYSMFSYCECCIFSRELIDKFDMKSIEGLTLLNEDVALINYIMSNDKYFAIADIYTKAIRKQNAGFVLSRYMDIEDISSKCSKLSISEVSDSCMDMIRTDYSELLLRARGYLCFRLFELKLAQKIGHFLRKIMNDKKGNAFNKNKASDSFSGRFYCWNRK